MSYSCIRGLRICFGSSSKAMAEDLYWCDSVKQNNSRRSHGRRLKPVHYMRHGWGLSFFSPPNFGCVYKPERWQLSIPNLMSSDLLPQIIGPPKPARSAYSQTGQPNSVSSASVSLDLKALYKSVIIIIIK